MRIKYSKQDIAELNQNPCVFNCTERLISYTYEFKIRALDLYTQGIKPKEIWKRSGFNTDKWRSNYFNETISDWKKIVKKNGTNGLLKTDGIQYDKGKSIDNAPIESFFGHMKDELDYKTCLTFKELKLKTTEYMQYYNHERKQWARNKMTPVEYRKHLLENIRVMG